MFFQSSDGKTGMEIKNTEITRTEDGNAVNTLRLNTITWQDAGDYVCTFQDEKDKVMGEVRVEVNCKFEETEVKIMLFYKLLGKSCFG